MSVMGECDLEVMGVQSTLNIIRKTATLVRVRTNLDLSWTEQAERRKWKSPRIVCYESRKRELKKNILFIMNYESKK